MGYTRHLASFPTVSQWVLDKDAEDVVEEKPKRFPPRVPCGVCRKQIAKPLDPKQPAFCKPCGELVAMAQWSASAKELVAKMRKRHAVSR